MDIQNMHKNLLTVALLLACMPLAQAAEATDAGPQQTPASAPQQAQALAEPQMAAQTQASFVLQGVEFAGATGVPESELQAVAAGMIGQNVTFQDLEKIAAKATEVYRKHGLALVQVFVPVQEVKDGLDKLQVVEGQLGDVTIDQAPATP